MYLAIHSSHDEKNVVRSMFVLARIWCFHLSQRQKMLTKIEKRYLHSVKNITTTQ